MLRVEKLMKKYESDQMSFHIFMKNVYRTTRVTVRPSESRVTNIILRPPFIGRRVNLYYSIQLENKSVTKLET